MGHEGGLTQEYLGSDRFGGACALVGSARGFALGLRSVRRFGRGGTICGQKCRKRAAGSFCVRAGSRRKNRSKIFSRASAGMPGPLSCTVSESSRLRVCT